MKDEMDIATVMADIGARARAAAAELAVATPGAKRHAIEAAADAVWQDRDAILAANAEDLALARDKGLSGAMLDRLTLDEDRIAGMVAGLRAVAAQDDPVGEVLAEWDRPSGLHIRRVRTPLGVVGVIFESRPNVTADAGALCLKSGNAVILRGGSESFHSSAAIHACLVAGLRAAACPRTRSSACRPATGPRCGNADHDRQHRRDRAARRQGPCGARAARGAGAGLCPSRRHRACLYRQGGGCREGAARGARCQDAAHGDLRGGRMPADPPRCRRHHRARRDRRADRRGRRGARRCGALRDRRHGARRPRGLGARISRQHHRRKGGRGYRRGHRPYPALWLGSHRLHPDRGCGAAQRSSPGSTARS